jgi:anti-sigma B factor antagonist
VRVAGKARVDGRGDSLRTIEFQISSAALGRGVQIVSLGGEVDAHTAPRLDEELAGAIDSGARRVVVDLAGASFIDSTVLGVLLRADKRLKGEGELVVVADDPRILRTLELTGLDRRLTIQSSLTEAIAKLSNGRTP